MAAPRFVKMLYDFTAEDGPELSVQQGDILLQLVQDALEATEGWVIVENADGKQGFVPEAYIVQADSEEARLFPGNDAAAAEAAGPPQEERPRLDTTGSSSGMTQPGAAGDGSARQPAATASESPAEPEPPAHAPGERLQGAERSSSSGDDAHLPIGGSPEQPPPTAGSAAPPAPSPGTPAAVPPPLPPAPSGARSPTQPAAPRSLATPAAPTPPPATAPKAASSSWLADTTLLREGAALSERKLDQSFIQNEVYFRSMMKQRAESLAKLDAALGEAAGEIASSKERNRAVMQKLQDLTALLREDKAKRAQQVEAERRAILSRLSAAAADAQSATQPLFKGGGL
eukprot:TRINITY_DN7754_c0_g1_i1.p1 TRINITY_DN7754_c0_g1~~TRINITY_DN7754_c0_g1_i1.p1  ORF type:complete len:376 (+),score=129.86 TRINITY_DN7754_c0_g1_i1:98-1129(+)